MIVDQMNLSRRHFLLRLLTGVALVFVYASMQAKAQTPSIPGWLDPWRLSTFSFGRVQTQNGRQFFEVIGTGVFVATTPQTGYIVTAKHVFDDPEKKWHPSELRLRFAWDEHKSVYTELGTPFKLLDSSGKPLWLACEDGADIAAIPVNIPDLHTSEIPTALSLQDIASAQELYEGANILALGYPGIVGNEYLVRAVSRGGIVAWVSPEQPDKKPFMIDANIYPGNSGGPVLLLPTGTSRSGTFTIGGKPKLLGIVSQAPGQNTDIILQVPGSNAPLRLVENIPLGGTGFIVPAMEIPPLLQRFSPPRK